MTALRKRLERVLVCFIAAPYSLLGVEEPKGRQAMADSRGISIYSNFPDYKVQHVGD